MVCTRVAGLVQATGEGNPRWKGIKDGRRIRGGSQREIYGFGSKHFGLKGFISSDEKESLLIPGFSTPVVL